MFVKEIEHALLTKEIDMAVHSMKDMPAVLPEGLMIGCTPKRVDPRDAFISKSGASYKELAEGAILGTSSLRRSAQLLAARPDLQVKWIRGNIDTRLRKLKEEDYDAIILATAGLQRMGWDNEVITEHLDETLCVPAVGQGALAIECREDDKDLLQLLAHINDAVTEKTVAAERVFLHKLEGGCQVPIAGYATITENDAIELTALVGSMDGSVLLKETVVGTDPEKVGLEAADRLIKQGAKNSFLLQIRGNNNMNALAGKTVLITRAQHQAKQMSVAVKEKSGIPLEIPLLRMEGMFHRQIQHIAGQLHSYDWVILRVKMG